MEVEWCVLVLILSRFWQLGNSSAPFLWLQLYPALTSIVSSEHHSKGLLRATRDMPRSGAVYGNPSAGDSDTQT